MDWDLARTSLWPLIRGALLGTIPLTLVCFALGLLLALVVALMRLSRFRALSAIARVYVSVIRGTPLLVQLFVIFYGLPSVGLTIDPWQFMSEKTLKGTFLGSARVHEDVPRLIDLYQSGDLELDRLVSRTLSLDELPDAFDRLRAGDVVRQVVIFD